MKATALILLFGLASLSDAFAQPLPDQASSVAFGQDTLSLVLVKRKYPNGWSVNDYNRWRVDYGTEPLPETTFLKVVGLNDQLSAAQERQKKFRRLQRRTQIVAMAGLVLMGGSLLKEDSEYLYGGLGASLAAASAGWRMIGINNLRKQGLSPADAQALVNQYNDAVAEDRD